MVHSHGALTGRQSGSPGYGAHCWDADCGCGVGCKGGEWLGGVRGCPEGEESLAEARGVFLHWGVVRSQGTVQVVIHDLLMDSIRILFIRNSQMLVRKILV